MRLILCSLILLAVSGCSMLGGSKPAPPAKQDRVMEFLDAGKPKAALVTADELVAEAPDDYQSYLTRNTVRLVLRDFPGAAADNEKALQVYEANTSRYPEKERNYRLAKIHESFALTDLLALRRTDDPDAIARLEKDLQVHADKVKELDEETWTNLRGLAGQKTNGK